MKIAETNEVIKELNLEVLQNKKEKNDKNAHLITDSVQKLEAAVVTDELYRNLWLSFSIVLFVESFP